MGMLSWITWFSPGTAAAQRGMPQPLMDYQRQPPVFLPSPQIPVPSKLVLQPARNLPPSRPWFQPAAHPQSTQAGMPPPLVNAERRPPSQVQHRPGFGLATYKGLRRNDWGAAGNAYDGGRLLYNPIGAGLVATRRGPKPFAAMIGQVIPGQGVIWRMPPSYGGGPAGSGKLNTATAIYNAYGALAAAIAQEPPDYVYPATSSNVAS